MDRKIKMMQHRRNVRVNKKRLVEEAKERREASKAEADAMADGAEVTDTAAEAAAEKKTVKDKKRKTEGEDAAAAAAGEAEEGEEGEDEEGEVEEPVEEDVVPEEEAAECDRRADAGEDVYDDAHMGMGELQSALSVWDPQAEPLKEGEELVFEPKAYDMLHRMTADWPALSFDVLRDSLGMQRKRYPHTMLLAAGTQADYDGHNKVTLMRVSQLCRTKHDKGADSDSDSDSESDSDSDSDSDTGADIDVDPVLETRDIHHQGTVNRLRANPVHPYLLAAWSSRGKVSVYDVKAWYRAMDREPEALSQDADEDADTPAGADTITRRSRAASELVADVPQRALHTFKHKCEGFALDWNVCQCCFIADAILTQNSMCISLFLDCVF